MKTIGDNRSYKLSPADQKGFRKAFKVSSTRRKSLWKKGLSSIRKARNVGTANLYWDKSM